MPLPTLRHAMMLGYVVPLPPGMCASCGTAMAATGHLMCHGCRAACDLYEQPPLIDDPDTDPGGYDMRRDFALMDDDRLEETP